MHCHNWLALKWGSAGVVRDKVDRPEDINTINFSVLSGEITDNFLLKINHMVRVFCLITLIVLNSVQFTATAQSRKVIIDCDPGVDDAMALVLAM